MPFKKYATRHNGSLELHANHTAWELSNQHVTEQNSSAYDHLYMSLVEDACKQFEKETGVEVFMEGRSGRHVCVKDTPENSRKLTYLRNKALRLEREVVKAWNEAKIKN